MRDSREFLRQIIDSVTDHIVVINASGEIQFVNQGWVIFGHENYCLQTLGWEGVNYLTICDQASESGEDYGAQAGAGIRSVVNGKIALFYFEYPCHSPDEERWFMMRVTPFFIGCEAFFVISHQNITERKLAEEKVLKLSQQDGLTGIPNRRRFDEFLNNEWKRCARLKMPVSLAIIDIDYFKLLNDTYGHPVGDDCLKQIASALDVLTKRPADICARYGGEEFAIVYGNTTLDSAKIIVGQVVEAIHQLNIPNERSPLGSNITVSVGLAMIYPSGHKMSDELVKAADKLLYSAKHGGRDQVVSGTVEVQET